MSADPLSQLESWAGVLLAKLEPPARRKLAVTIARELRRSQQQRIAAQRDAEGAPFVPRKPRLRERSGAIRRRAAMFSKLRTARWLRASGTADAAHVGFAGRVARIARVHQEGLRDRPVPNAHEVRYPRRAMLGFSDIDRERIRDLLWIHLSR
ncbi:phage virion morphogenesis protein [Dyella marensis]|uniref:phage virion morphogenesis protein n=1 Tax=Dyella marensis TaxID=500610 RepID=UPI0031DB142D